MTFPSFLRLQADAVLLSVKLQPRASANEIGQPLGDKLRIRLTAPPVDAAANEALIAFLAKRFDCAKSRVELVRGHTSRHKVIKLQGMTAETVLAGLGQPAVGRDDRLTK